MTDDPFNFTYKKSSTITENPFFSSLYIFCETTDKDKAFVVVEISSIALLGEAIRDKDKDESDEDAYGDIILSLIKDTQKSLTINFIDTEYERSKQGFSKNSIN